MVSALPLLLALLLAAVPPDTARIRARLHPWGTPRSADTALVVLRSTAYDCGYSPRLKLARWAAYFYTPGGPRRARHHGRFVADPRLPADRSPGPDDYRGAFRRDLSGFDRGHLAPDASLKVFGARAQAETYYLTNTTPQHSRTNRGPWLEVEDSIRRSVGEGETAWAVVGPVFFAGRDTQWLGCVAVPHAYFAVRAGKRPPLSTAWLIPNAVAPAPDRPLQSWIVPLDSVERLTGLDLLPGLSQ